MPQTIKKLILLPIVTTMIALSFVMLPTFQPSALAASDTGCQGSNACKDPANDPNLDCSSKNGCDLIAKYVNPGINLLSVMFGLIAVISLIAAGIQYSSSAGDSQKVTQAKNRIANTLFAIVAYFFLYAFLQFLIPGGIFNR